MDEPWNSLSQWRECLIPSLALGDLSLVEFLWDKTDGDADTILGHLRLSDWPEDWDAELVEEWDGFKEQGEITRTLTSVPPLALKKLWAKGYVTSSLEYGPELASLYLLHLNRMDELKHRVWRGQVDLLLPMIDNIRLLTCKQLTREKGPQWPYKWEKPQSLDDLNAVMENPLATEIGFLNLLLQHNTNFRNDRQWKNLIFIAMRLRNQIAHYQPVNYCQFQELLAEIDSAI